MPSLRMIKAVWADSESSGNAAWNTLSRQLEWAKEEVPLIETVGYLIHIDSDHVCLTDTVVDSQCGIVWKIPLPSVRCLIQFSGRDKPVVYTDLGMYPDYTYDPEDDE